MCFRKYNEQKRLPTGESIIILLNDDNVIFQEIEGIVDDTELKWNKREGIHTLLSCVLLELHRIPGCHTNIIHLE